MLNHIGILLFFSSWIIIQLINQKNINNVVHSFGKKISNKLDKIDYVNIGWNNIIKPYSIEILKKYNNISLSFLNGLMNDTNNEEVFFIDEEKLPDNEIIDIENKEDLINESNNFLHVNSVLQMSLIDNKHDDQTDNNDNDELIAINENDKEEELNSPDEEILDNNSSDTPPPEIFEEEPIKEEDDNITVVEDNNIVYISID